jgi:hypothetical protein
VVPVILVQPVSHWSAIKPECYESRIKYDPELN